MARKIKSILIVLLVGVVAYNSVYFKKLDEVKTLKAAKDFDATRYAQTFWDTKLMPSLDKAVDLGQLVSMLSNEQKKTFETYSHALGIGNLRYFLVIGNGTVRAVEPDYVTVNLDANTRITLATEFIFGNAVRDASGLISINEFVNMMDFNNVSAEINKIIRERVLPPFRNSVKEGDQIQFVGAIETNKEHPELYNIEVIPIQLSIQTE